MKNFESGVKFYTLAEGTVHVYFPEGRTVCQWCRYARNEDSLRRWRCLLTDEYLVYPFDSIGNQCPLKIVKEETNGSACTYPG